MKYKQTQDTSYPVAGLTVGAFAAVNEVVVDDGIIGNSVSDVVGDDVVGDVVVSEFTSGGRPKRVDPTSRSVVTTAEPHEAIAVFDLTRRIFSSVAPLCRTRWLLFF